MKKKHKIPFGIDIDDFFEFDLVFLLKAKIHTRYMVTIKIILFVLLLLTKKKHNKESDFQL